MGVFYFIFKIVGVLKYSSFKKTFNYNFFVLSAITLGAILTKVQVGLDLN